MFNGIQKYETKWRHGMDNMHVWQVQHIAPHVGDKWVECYFSLLHLPELSTGQGEPEWHVARSPTSSRLWGEVKAISCNYYRENFTPLVIYSETWRMCQCIATLDISVSWHDEDLVAVLRSWSALNAWHSKVFSFVRAHPFGLSQNNDKGRMKFGAIERRPLV